MKFEERMHALPALLAPLLSQGEYVHALGVAWMAVVHADIHEYAEKSRDCLGLSDRMDRLRVLMEFDYSHVDEAKRNLEELLKADACGVLMVLDALVSQRPSVPAVLKDGCGAAAASAYGVENLFVQLRPEESEALGLSEPDTSCWLVRRPDCARAPIEAQYQDPHVHTPNWIFVPRVFDRNSPSREAGVTSAAAGLSLNFKRLIAGKSMRIYLAEFGTIPDFVPVDPQDHTYWTAADISNKAVLRQEVFGHLQNALDRRCDVVLFPELTMPADLRRDVAEWLSEHNLPDESLGRSQLLLVVAGSFHEPTAGGHFNSAFALSGQGEELLELTHHKLCGVDLQTPQGQLMEKIVNGARINLLFTDAGLHALLICLDLAQKGYSELLLNRLPVTWWWVPSLSEGVKPHRDQAGKLSISRYCIVACANQGPSRFYPGADVAFEKSRGLSFVVTTRVDEAATYEEAEDQTWKISRQPLW